jgi:uncharacterized protein (UPF0261 family)
MTDPVERAYVVGTCDTKGEELRYVRDLLRRAGVPALLVDVGIRRVDGGADIDPGAIAAFHPDGAATILEERDRGKAVVAMSEAFRLFVRDRKDIGGMIGLGGSGGTAIIAPALRALPIGTPKILVSTVASGNVRPYVGASDICMLYSVTDILGINSISAPVLANAAHALAGMMQFRLAPAPADKLAVGFTMFGVTTAAVSQVVAVLRDEYDCLVFHATGIGGQSMEALVDAGKIRAVIDLTTTEICDLLLGGVQPADPDRLGAIARTRVSYVGSCGALDMVNFGAMSKVPVRYLERRLHAHNAQVTLMRTTPEENERMGEWLGAKLNACEGPVRFLLPLGGVSAIDIPGGPFHYPEANAALFAALRRSVVQTANRQLVELPHHINDPAFAAAVVNQFRAIC